MQLAPTGSLRSIPESRRNDLACLAILAEAERRGLGWERRGARGWLGVGEIEAVAKRKLSDICPRLAARQLVHPLDLCEFGYRRRLYRITQPGSALIDDLVGGERRAVESVATEAEQDEGRCPINAAAWSAVLGLRWAAGNVRLSMHREPGWFLLREVREAYPTERPAPFSTLEFQGLRQRGFVEQRRVLGEVRRLSPAAHWKLSLLGERIEVISDHRWPGRQGLQHHWLDARVHPEPVQLDLPAEIERSEAPGCASMDLVPSADDSLLAALIPSSLPHSSHAHE